MTTPIPPGIDHGNQWFWDGVNEHRLLVQRCSRCGTLRYPSGPMCANCQSLEWEPHEVTGRGTVYAWLVSHHPNDPEGDGRIVVLVDLDEGLRLVSNVVDADITEIDHDVPLQLTFRTYGDVTLPQFEVVR